MNRQAQIMPAKRLAPLLPPLYFLVLTLLYLMPLPLHWTTHVPGDATLGDSVVNTWPFWYYPYAITHHITPFFHPDLQFYPDGISLLQTTSNVVGSVLMAPISLTLGVCAAVNTWILLQLWLGGWFFYKFIRRLGPGPVSAYFSASAYATSPFVTAHIPGHYTLVCIGFPAAILFIGLVLYQEHPTCHFRRATLAIAMGFLWVALALTDFNLTIMTLLLFAGLLLHLIHHDGLQKVWYQRFPVYLLIGIATSAIGILPVYFLLLQDSGLNTDIKHIQQSAGHVIDLSILALPPSHHWLFTLFSGQGLSFSYNDLIYESGYLGLALLFAVIVALTRYGVAKKTLAWLIAGGLAFALAGGNSFTEDSPFTWVQRLIGRFWPTSYPLREFRVPSRWIFALQACAAIITAFGLDQLLRQYAQRRQLIILGLFALLALDHFRPPMIANNGPEGTAIPIGVKIKGTVLDLGIGFWSGNGSQIGSINFGAYRRQMFHARPILSIFTARLLETQVKSRLADPELAGLLILQQASKKRIPPEIPDLDWPGFARRFDITTIRIPGNYRHKNTFKALGERMLPGISWTEYPDEIIGNAPSGKTTL